ncbi:TIGR02587 family membrane protein [Brevundimonas sp. NPDC092305]|uniref:TIGR02587 family membrane protein n=1 Tax=Brevundimonas sp. NPDC092305 TaxID=3363957 RepID=UPI003800089F
MSAAATLNPPDERDYARDLGRAFGGALLFSLPLLMTMEMWWFGFTLDRARLAIFLLVGLPLLLGIALYAGFSRHQGLLHAIQDTFVAIAVGMITGAALLLLFGVIEPGGPLRQSVGQIALQTVPAAMGALLARKQLSGAGRGKGDEDEASYFGELFLMVAGALFIALNMAPTEEMILIAYRITPWHALALVAVSLTLMHVIVYLAGFAGQEEQGHPVTAFFHFTLAGYGLVLLTSLYVLWIFGRTDGHNIKEMVDAVVVLSFPGAIGAAAARLLV